MGDWVTPSGIYSFCGEYGLYPVSNTIDDDTGTVWIHLAIGYHWVVFDLGESKDLTKIRIFQSMYETYRFGYTVGLEVYVSDDPENWGDPVWDGLLNAAGWQESGVFSKSGRYVKLVSKSNWNMQGIYEFDAFVGDTEEGGILTQIM